MVRTGFWTIQDPFYGKPALVYGVLQLATVPTGLARLGNRNGSRRALLTGGGSSIVVSLIFLPRVLLAISRA